MPLTVTTATSVAHETRADWLAIFIGKDGALIGSRLPAATKRTVTAALDTLGFEASQGAIAWIPNVAGVAARGVAVVGIGDPSRLADWRSAAGTLGRAAAKSASRDCHACGARRQAR